MRIGGRGPAVLIQGGFRVEGPQTADIAYHLVDDKIDLRLRRETPQAETQTAMSQLVSKSERPQHIARLNAGRSAHRAGADCHVFYAHHEGLALDLGETQVQVA